MRVSRKFLSHAQIQDILDSMHTLPYYTLERGTDDDGNYWTHDISEADEDALLIPRGLRMSEEYTKNGEIMVEIFKIKQ